MKKFLALKNKIVDSKDYDTKSQQNRNISSITSSHYKIKTCINEESSIQHPTFREQGIFQQQTIKDTMKLLWNQDTNISQISGKQKKILKDILANLNYLQNNDKLSIYVSQIRRIFDNLQPLIYSPRQKSQTSFQHNQNDHSLSLYDELSCFQQRDSQHYESTSSQEISIHYKRIPFELAQQNIDQPNNDNILQMPSIFSINQLPPQSDLCAITQRYQQQQSSVTELHDSIQYKKILYMLEGSTNKKSTHQEYSSRDFQKQDTFDEQTQPQNKQKHNNKYLKHKSYEQQVQHQNTQQQIRQKTSTNKYIGKQNIKSKKKILNDIISLLNNKYNKQLKFQNY